LHETLLQTTSELKDPLSDWLPIVTTPNSGRRWQFMMSNSPVHNGEIFHIEEREREEKKRERHSYKRERDGRQKTKINSAANEFL
jgi:hypothetical protein